MRVRLQFEPRDIWVGVYWKLERIAPLNASILHLYICVLPMLPLHIEKAWRWH